jgi:hypothetical protein
MAAGMAMAGGPYSPSTATWPGPVAKRVHRPEKPSRRGHGMRSLASRLNPYQTQVRRKKIARRARTAFDTLA